MASDLDFVEFVCEQIEGSGTVRYRKMFGEYMVYVDDKPLLLVCNNRVFVKKLESLDQIMQNSETGYPYKGAREHYILDIDDRDHSMEVVRLIEPLIPIPEKKKKRLKG